ncbi:spore germination protein [Alicyclobacillaceae bacterium I2511]|nr:spore germination protein [Alicyclobacillaceae bacterium I2511]
MEGPTLFRKSNRLDISTRLADNERQLQNVLTPADDLFFRRLTLGDHQQVMLVFLTDLVGKELLDLAVLQGLFKAKGKTRRWNPTELQQRLIAISEVTMVQSLESVVTGLLAGQAVLFIEGHGQALLLDVLSWEHRGVQKTENEVSLRGSQASFTENLVNNIAQLRRFLPTPDLKVELQSLKSLPRVRYGLVYHQKFAQASMVTAVRRRIANADAEGLLDSGALEEAIRDHPWSPFPTINYTERPDRLAAQLLEGKVGIFMENSPTVLTAPALFAEFLQVPEDYYQNFLMQSGIRLLRNLSLLISLLLPGLYVAIMDFHHELIPRALYISLAQQRQGVPLPLAMEVFLLEIFFELLREAGLRLPRPIGQSVSIVGGLVIGEAAVQAHLVMAGTVIMVALTGIASFVIPGYEMAGALRILRFIFLLFSALLGSVGFVLTFMGVLFHVSSLKSFEIPYLHGYLPSGLQHVGDVWIRGPHYSPITPSWHKNKQGIFGGQKGGGRRWRQWKRERAP